MTEHEPVDLIHLSDDLGNSVVLRITGRDSDGLTGVIEVGSYFVSGGIKTSLTPEDLAAWGEILDSLADGAATATWRENQRAPELHLETDDDRVTVTVVDSHSFLVTVELTIEVPTTWIKDHQSRLTTLQETFPA